MRLFVFGLGFSAQTFIHELSSTWSHVAGTVRQQDKAERLRLKGIEAYALGEAGGEEAIAHVIRQADAILVSTPVSAEGDPTLSRFKETIATAAHAKWIGYLSTTGVYGDHGGAWIDETASLNPKSRASQQRVEAEQAWLALGRETGVPVQVFRLTGIYGPGRNALVNLAKNTARRIIKPGQVFNRIHVADIAQVLAASLHRPRARAIYNVSDDEPAPQQDVVEYAARLAGIEPPPAIAFEDADLLPTARSFYSENKRVSNGLIKEEFGLRLRYPTYREGLQALHAAGEYSQAA